MNAGLVHAERVRLGQAQIRRELKSLGRKGSHRAAEMLLEGEADHAFLDYFLKSVPGLGPLSIDATLRAAGVSLWAQKRKVGRLTQREREALAGVLTR